MLVITLSEAERRCSGERAKEKATSHSPLPFYLFNIIKGVSGLERIPLKLKPKACIFQANPPNSLRIPCESPANPPRIPRESPASPPTFEGSERSGSACFGSKSEQHQQQKHAPFFFLVPVSKAVTWADGLHTSSSRGGTAGQGTPCTGRGRQNPC